MNLQYGSTLAESKIKSTLGEEEEQAASCRGVSIGAQKGGDCRQPEELVFFWAVVRQLSWVLSLPL